MVEELRASRGLQPRHAGDPAQPLPGTDATVRFVRAEDITSEVETQLLALIERGFNGGPYWFDYPSGPLEHFRWKYRDCPAGTEFMIVERAGQIVHMAGYRNRRARIAGREALVIDGGESVLDPSLQGSGFAYHVADHSSRHPGDQHDFAIRMISHPGQRRRLPQRGFMHPVGNPLLQLTRPLDLGRLVAAQTTPRATGRSRTAASLQPWWRRALRRSSLVHRADWTLRRARNRLSHGRARAVAGSWQLRGCTEFDGRLDALFEAAATQFDVISVRDAQYLQWRYLDPRAGDFVLRVAEEDGKLLGYCALHPSAGEAAIADVLALPGRLDVVQSLVEDAVRLAEAAGATSIRTWVQARHAYRSVFHRLGFVAGRETQVPLLHFALINIPPDPGEILARPDTRIHLTLGDSDHL